MTVVPSQPVWSHLFQVPWESNTSLCERRAQEWQSKTHTYTLPFPFITSLLTTASNVTLTNGCRWAQCCEIHPGQWLAEPYLSFEKIKNQMSSFWVKRSLDTIHGQPTNQCWPLKGALSGIVTQTPSLGILQSQIFGEPSYINPINACFFLP